MQVTLNFDALKVFNEALHRTIAERFNIKSGGPHQIDVEALPEVQQRQLHEFFVTQLDAAVAADAEKRAHAEQKANAAAEDRAKIDAIAAQNRINHWVNEGLLNNEANGNLLKQWVEENEQGYWDADVIDRAVTELRSRLVWKKVAAPAAAPAKPVVAPPPAAAPAPKVEKVVILSDGSPQLPITAVPNHTHTKAQLQDLDRRLRERSGRKSTFHGVRFV